MATFEVAVAGGDAVFAGGELVAVHGDAHGAAGFAPIGTGVFEDAVEAFGLGLLFDKLRAGHDHDAHVGIDFAAFEDAGGLAEIGDAGVGATADEHNIDGVDEQGFTCGEIHITQSFAESVTLYGVANGCGIGHVLRDADAHAGVGAEGDHGFERVGVDVNGFVVLGAGIGGELAPDAEGFFPLGAFGCGGATGEILIGGVIGRNETGPRAAFDGHVADGHALFHGERANGGAGVFEDATVAAADADARDEIQDDIFGADAGTQGSIDTDFISERAALQQALRGEDVFHLTGADAERECTECAVRGGVAVTADDGLAGLREALFGSDDVNDALVLAERAVERDAEFVAVLFKLSDLRFGDLVDDGQRAIMRGDAVIGGADGEIGTAHFDAAFAEAGEGLGRGDFVHKVQVNIQERGGAGALRYDVVVPHLFNDCALHNSFQAATFAVSAWHTASPTSLVVAGLPAGFKSAVTWPLSKTCSMAA